MGTCRGNRPHLCPSAARCETPATRGNAASTIGAREPRGNDTISVDGVSLNDLDLVVFRERTAACYQGFARYELLARKVVGIGDVPHVDDLTAVTAATERAAAEEVVAGLADGYNTQLGATFDGVDLSGGQWQSSRSPDR